jgi:transposase-like protein
MFSYEERMKAIQLFIQYDCSPSVVIHELGYPSRGMLYNWYKEYIATGALRSDDMLRNAKYSKEQRKQVVEYYLQHGQSITRTIRALGYPGKTILSEWLRRCLHEIMLKYPPRGQCTEYEQRQEKKRCF